MLLRKEKITTKVTTSSVHKLQIENSIFALEKTFLQKDESLQSQFDLSIQF